MNTDYYSVLGVARDADQDTIKKAYRKLAMQYHPDKNPGDKSAEDKFKEAARAYEVLGNSDKRSRYDRFGEAGVNGPGGGGGHQFEDLNDIFGAFGDIFGDFFGGGRGRHSGGRSRARRGADLRYFLEIQLSDVLDGADKEIQFDSEDTCKTCSGSGAKAGSSPETCGTCGGSGQVVRQQGFFSVATTCPGCGGEGRIVKDPCEDCHGHGRVQAKRKLSVKVPAGVETGTQLRLTGKGEAGEMGGPSGDLYVEIRVKKDKRFEREGQHLVTHRKISYLKGLLGAEIEIPTLGEAVTVEVPPGTASGDVLRVTGEGLPSLRSSRRGDLLIEVEVEIPKKLTKKEEALLREIAELKGEKVAEEKGLFGRFK